MPRNSISSVATFPGGAAVSQNPQGAQGSHHAGTQLNSEPAIREAADLDVPWICEVLSAQSSVRAQTGGRLHTPHPDADSRRNRFIASAVESEGTLVWRTRRAFIMATLPEGNTAFVENLGGMPDHIVSSDIAALLVRLRQKADIHLTVPHADSWLGKVATRLEGRVTETLWSRDLPPQKLLASASSWPPAIDDVPPAFAQIDPEVLASSNFVPPSALHAPGGPVLMLTAGTSGAELLQVEELAARYGAAAAVVQISGSTTSPTLEAALRASGHHLTTTTYFIPQAPETPTGDDSDAAKILDAAQDSGTTSGSSTKSSSEPKSTAPNDQESTPEDNAPDVIDLRDHAESDVPR